MSSGEMTKARQQKIVGEGLAVGLLALGVKGVTSRKQAVEFAFGRASRNWAHRSRFPQVRADISRNNILAIMHDSASRQGAVLADWSCEKWCEPQLLVDWPVEEAGDAMAEESGVAFAQWVELAEAFVGEFGEDEVRR
jgi:hypothetical protein